MGNQQSGPLINPLQQLLAAKAQQQQQVPDTRADIEKKRVELNMSKNDTKAKQSEFDKLVPSEAEQRIMDKANLELADYLNTTEKIYNTQQKLYDQTLDQIDHLANSPTLIITEKYKKEMEQKEAHLSNQYMINKEKAFTERRRFLDSNPQEGVSGIGWLASVDEQILAVFWLSYLLFIISSIVMFMINYGANYLGSVNNMVIVGIFVFSILVYVGHVSIKTFAVN